MNFGVNVEGERTSVEAFHILERRCIAKMGCIRLSDKLTTYRRDHRRGWSTFTPSVEQGIYCAGRVMKITLWMTSWLRPEVPVTYEQPHHRYRSRPAGWEGRAISFLRGIRTIIADMRMLTWGRSCNVDVVAPAKH